MKTVHVFFLTIMMLLVLTSCTKKKDTLKDMDKVQETIKDTAGDDINKEEAEMTEYKITSLSNIIEMSIYQNEKKQLCYLVKKADGTGEFVPWIKESKFGIFIDSVEYFVNSKITDVKTESTDFEYSFLGNQSTLKNHGISSTYTIEQEGYTYYLDVRVYDDGVAFRYRFPGSEPGTEREVKSETTTFTVADTAVRYWAGENNTDYESPITAYDPKSEAKGKKLTGPITFEMAGGGYLAILEGVLNGSYGGTNLIALGEGRFQICNTWSEKESKAYLTAGDITTGWRLINVSEDLNGIVNNYNVYHLNDAPDQSIYGDISWIEPGRSAWSWLTDYGNSLGTPDAMYTYTLNAARLGFEYNVIDEGWTKWQNYKEILASIGQYGEALNVKEILWAYVSGSHNALQVVDSNSADKLINFLKDTHMYGSKIDFWWSEELIKTTQLQQELLQKFAKEKLVINFHGANKPTGFNVTYPNELSREGIRGLENIGASDNKNYTTQASWLTAQLFTRYLAGHADWTPACNTGMQIASLILIDSPMNVIATDPEHILSNPALELIKSIPTTWNRTKVLSNSKIGELAVFAKESNHIWFAGGIAASSVGTYQLTLSEFLGEGEYTMELWYDKNASGTKEVITKNVTKNDVIGIANLESGMGFAARFSKLSLSSYGGEINGPITVSTASKDAVVKYTIDGTDPFISGIAPDDNGRIVLTDSCYLKVAITEGDGAGTLISHKYNKIQLPVIEHKISGEGDGMKITFASDVEAQIYYTTDGSIPTTSSSLYTEAVSVPKSTTFRVLAVPVSGGVPAYYTAKVINKDMQAIEKAVPDVYLGTGYKEATTGWDADSPKVDVNLKGSGKISIAGIVFEHGITTNSIGQFVYEVPSNAKRFVGVAGVDDIVYENAGDGVKGSIDCAILFDGKEIIKTGTLWRDDCYVIDVEVPDGAKEIKIIFGDGGNGITCDNAAMGNAGWIVK